MANRLDPMRRWPVTGGVALLSCLLLGVVAVPVTPASTDLRSCRVRNLTQGTAGRAFAAMVARSVDGDVLTVRGTCVVRSVTIGTNITVRGVGARKAVLDARGLSRVLWIRRDAVATVRDIAITGGLAPSGGGIYNAGTLTLAGSASVHDNLAWGVDWKSGGGGIYNTGTLTLAGSASVHDNRTAGVLEVVDLRAGGGGIYNTGNLTLHGSSSIRRNTAAEGGGVYNASGTVTLEDESSVDHNAALDGGGIENSGTLTLHGSSSVHHNTYTGIASGHGTITLNDSASVHHNVEGGIQVESSTLTMNASSSVSHNVGDHGGGISTRPGSTLVMNDSASIHHNVAVWGGGIYAWDPTLDGRYCGTRVHDNEPDDCAVRP